MGIRPKYYNGFHWLFVGLSSIESWDMKIFVFLKQKPEIKKIQENVSSKLLKRNHKNRLFQDGNLLEFLFLRLSMFILVVLDYILLKAPI
jgi:hypothetical protein